MNTKDRNSVERWRKRHGVISTFVSALCLGAVSFVPAAHAAAPPDSTPPADSVPAQEAGSFAVQPWTPAGAGGRDYFIYELKAGTAYSDKVTISNDSDQKATYAVYPTDAVNTDDGSFSLLREEDKPKDVGNWVELGATQYTLEPHTQVIIPFSVTVPDDAISGDHVGAIVAQKIADASDPDGIGLNVRVRVGARLYVRIDGPKTPSLAVDSFSVAYDAPGSPFAGSTAHINYVLTNTGNVRLSPTAAVRMAGIFGLGEQHLPDRQIPEILPGSSIQISEVLLGVKPYVHLTADLTVQVPDEPSVVVHTSIDQWAIPWIGVGVIALILVAVLGRRVWTRRRRKAPE
jgi:hypothetical protein